MTVIKDNDNYEIIENKGKQYALVVDSKGRKLSPTDCNKAGYLIRKGRAKLINKYPMVIQLKYEVKESEVVPTVIGIDVGSKYTGIGLVLGCKTYNKPVIKGTIYHRTDVSKKMIDRAGYRRYHRQHKRYRPARFSNRGNSKKQGRLAPSIKTKKDEILRVVKFLNNYINIDKIIIEDVAIDIRALTEGYKPYKWEYSKSNRLDENIRKAVILRDNNTCQECGVKDTEMEVHHIVPRRLKGSNTLGNLISLCSKCHQATQGVEERCIERYQSKIGGKSLRLDYAQHVMQGKTYLREELSKMASIVVTDGGSTANKRIDWGIEKSHSNDGLVICDLVVDSRHVNVLKDYILKPLRKKIDSKEKVTSEIRHRDVVLYSPRGKKPIVLLLRSNTIEW